jgi:hypothetical protein
MRAIVPHEPSSQRTGEGEYDAGMALWLQPSRFRCAWAAVVAIRCVCCLFLFSAVRLYQLLSSRELEWYMNFLSPNADELFVPAGHLYALLGAVHIIELALMVVHSVRARQLVFEGPSFEPAALCSMRRRWTSRLSKFVTVRYLARTSSRVSSLRSEVSARGQHFKIKFLLRETVEMVSQTIQAYQSSALIAREWMNHIYVAALFVNSWSTPVVEHFTRHSLPLERVACLAVDLTLDAIMSIALPVLVVVPHFAEFDSSTMMFDPAAVYTLKSFNRLIMESRQVLAHDWVDLSMKLIPHVSILGCLSSIQSLMRRSSVKVTHGNPTTVDPAKTSGPRKSCIPLVTSENSPSGGRWHRLRRMQTWILLLHSVFVLWGGAILCVHLKASSRSSSVPTGCMQQMHPWFAEKMACSIYKYDCAEHKSTSPSEDSLLFLDEKSLVQLVFANCPQLVMPSAIQHFHALLGIDIWGSTIAEWGEQSALTGSHDALVYLGFLETNMSMIPPGVLLDLPPQLHDIEITHSNLTDLPEDLHERWRHVSTLFVEFCKLEHIPSALTKMQLYDLSLIGNNLTDVHELQQSVSNYHSLLLSRNPLTSLPDEAIRADILAVDFTSLASLPTWVTSAHSGLGVVYAFDTPFCTSHGDSMPVTCADVNFDKDGRYPVALVKSLNAA